MILCLDILDRRMWEWQLLSHYLETLHAQGGPQLPLHEGEVARHVWKALNLTAGFHAPIDLVAPAVRAGKHCTDRICAEGIRDEHPKGPVERVPVRVASH